MDNGEYWDPPRFRGRSRRRFLVGVPMSGAGLALIAACGGAKQAKPPPARATGTSPAAAVPRRGGTLVHLPAVSGLFATGFDPHTSPGSDVGPMTLFYQGLARLNPATAQVEPEMAPKWEQPSDTEYLFHLAPGIKWHNKPPLNGRPLVAEDVVFSLNRVRTNDPRFINRTLLTQVDRIEAPDQNSVRVTTKDPDVTTLVNLADLTLAVIAPEVVAKWDKLTTAEQVIGTGAFMLRDYDPTSAVTVRNPDYWKPGLPYLDSVKLVNIADPAAQWAAFLAGQLDLATIPGDQVKKVLADEHKTYQTGLAKSNFPSPIWPNTLKAPFNDNRVTRALKLFIDHQESQTAWIETWFGGGSSYILPQAFEPWDLTKDEYASKLEWKQPKDEAARQGIALLQAAGFSKDNPLKFDQLGAMSPRYDAALPLAQAEWAQLSQRVLQPDLKQYDQPTSLSLQTRGEFGVVGPIGRANYFDPDQYLRRVFHTKESQNFGGYSDPTLDGMIDKERAIFDVERRKAAVKDIIRYIIDNSPYTNFGSPGLASAWQQRVKDISPESGRPHMWQYEHVWLSS